MTKTHKERSETDRGNQSQVVSDSNLNSIEIAIVSLVTRLWKPLSHSVGFENISNSNGMGRIAHRHDNQALGLISKYLKFKRRDYHACEGYPPSLQTQAPVSNSSLKGFEGHMKEKRKAFDPLKTEYWWAWLKRPLSPSFSFSNRSVICFLLFFCDDRALWMKRRERELSFWISGP